MDSTAVWMKSKRIKIVVASFYVVLGEVECSGDLGVLDLFHFHYSTP